MSDTLSKALSTKKCLSDIQIMQQAVESQNVTLTTNRKKRKGCRCSTCGATGHGCGTYPKLEKGWRRKQNSSQKHLSNCPEVEPRPTAHLLNVIEQCYCIVFDIETTSFSI